MPATVDETDAGLEKGVSDMLLSAPIRTGQSGKSLDLPERIGEQMNVTHGQAKLLCINSRIARCYVRHRVALEEEVKPLIAERDAIMAQLPPEASVDDVIADQCERDIDGDKLGTLERPDPYDPT
jgi:hypothetical protein